jgi:hypothetical protein
MVATGGTRYPAHAAEAHVMRVIIVRQAEIEGHKITSHTTVLGQDRIACCSYSIGATGATMCSNNNFTGKCSV